MKRERPFYYWTGIPYLFLFAFLAACSWWGLDQTWSALARGALQVWQWLTG